MSVYVAPILLCGWFVLADFCIYDIYACESFEPGEINQSFIYF